MEAERRPVLRQTAVWIVILVAAVAAALLLPRPGAAAGSERVAIEDLLRAVDESGLVWIRNGSEHDAHAAAAHLRAKWQAAGARVRTAEDFIDGIASRSSLSGRPYLVRLPDGSTVPAADWLRARLAERG